MEISIIIPTHNRSTILETCLTRIFQNNFPKTKYEVIVIDDASTDNTEEICENWSKAENLRYLKQKKAGQGVARNKGIELAKGKIVLFLGDDIFVNKTFLQEHFESHQKYPEINYGILGLILWDPEINISDLMNWSTNGSTLFGKFGGHQFAFEKLQNNKEANYNFFYTSNISLKKELLNQNKFDPWFDGYGWEDIELGYRLEKNNNFKLIYNASAIAYHHHEISIQEFKNRMFQIGHATHLFQKKHPEINKLPSPSKKFIFNLISNNLSLKIIQFLNKISQNKLNPLYFYCLSKHFYLKGLNTIPTKLQKL